MKLALRLGTKTLQFWKRMIFPGRDLSCFSVALLVFFPASAGTGIVPADFRAGANWFGIFGLRRACLELHFLLLTPLAALDFTRFIFRLGRLNQEQVAHGLGVDASHHVFEQRERFLLEFDQGIFLPI